MAAAMGLLLKANFSFVVVNRDSKPSLPLKWRRNPASLQTTTTTTTQISLPSSLIKNSCNRGGSDFRVQCVVNNNSNKNCFKKEEKEKEKEKENPFERFGKVMLKVLEKPVFYAMLKVLEKLVLAGILVWKLLEGNIITFLGYWLVFDLCEAIWSISSQYLRIGKVENIKIPVGPVLCSILVFLVVWFTGFSDQEPKMTLGWTPSSKGSVFGFVKQQKMTLKWTLSSKGSVDAK